MSKNIRNTNNKFERKKAQNTQKEIQEKQKQQTRERKDNLPDIEIQMQRWLDKFINGDQYSNNKETFLTEMSAILAELSPKLSKEFFPTLHIEQTQRINTIYEKNVMQSNSVSNLQYTQLTY